jgi:hypothetical protein
MDEARDDRHERAAARKLLELGDLALAGGQEEAGSGLHP